MGMTDRMTKDRGFGADLTFASHISYLHDRDQLSVSGRDNIAKYVCTLNIFHTVPPGVGRDGGLAMEDTMMRVVASRKSGSWNEL